MKEIFKNYWYVLIIIICIVLICFIYDSSNSNEMEFENLKKEEELIKESGTEEIKKLTSYYVDIKGEILNPGVYEIESDKRIIDVINKAGGLTKNADTSLLNLSKKVTDEMSIKIYSKSEVKKAKEGVQKEPEVIEIIKEIEKECVCPEINEICNNKNDAVIEDNSSNIENSNENDKLINLNTATKEELMNIPNIGESKADGIIEYRQKNKFQKIEDILNVSGIGNALFEKIKQYITV